MLSRIQGSCIIEVHFQRDSDHLQLVTSKFNYNEDKQQYTLTKDEARSLAYMLLEASK